MESAKKNCILLEAARAFARFGFKKTSIDEIARAAGVAKGTVYLACTSKEDLFYQVLNREIRAWSAEAANLLDRRRPATELLALLSDQGLAYLDEHPLVRDLLFGRLDESLPSFSDRLETLRRLGTTNVIEVLRLGIDQGLFRKGLDVDVVASLLLDLQISMYLFHDRGDDREARLAERRRVGLDLVLGGLLAGRA